MLPHSQDGPYDAAPTSDAVGLRVGMVIDGQLRYGRVTYVDGRKVRVQFERKLGNRHSITVNWEGLRIAKEQTTPPPPPPRPHVDPERIAHLRAIIDSQLPPISRTQIVTIWNTSALALYTALQEHIRELDIMRQRIHALVTDYNDHRERCLAMGIRSTPPPIESHSRHRSTRHKKTCRPKTPPQLPSEIAPAPSSALFSLPQERKAPPQKKSSPHSASVK
jgi:hypothetical protein